MSFEGVTKDIKDERQPMGKGKTVLKMGGEQYSTGTGATARTGTLLTTVMSRLISLCMN